MNEWPIDTAPPLSCAAVDDEEDEDEEGECEAACEAVGGERGAVREAVVASLANERTVKCSSGGQWRAMEDGRLWRRASTDWGSDERWARGCTTKRSTASRAVQCNRATRHRQTGGQ